MNFHLMFTRLAMIVTVALFVAACGRGQPPAETPTPTYAPIVFGSEAGGFSLFAPPGWTATETVSVVFGDRTILGQVNLDPAPPAAGTTRPGLIYYADVRELSRAQALTTLCHTRCLSLPAMSEITLSGRPAWITSVGTEPWTFVDNGDVLVIFNMPHGESLDVLNADPLARAANSMYFTPIIDGARRAHEAADALRGALALQLGAAVQIASVDPVTWPDACLGAPLADELCAEMETPGYRIELETPAGVYAYHLEPVSTQTRLAAAPEPQTGDPLIAWASTSLPCTAAVIGMDGLGFGACGGVLMPGGFSDDDQRAELASFAAIYAGFDAHTPAGDLTFFGNGARTATPTEERMITEWARTTVAAASGGDDDDSVMKWTRNGGILDACDALQIDITGRVRASSCRDGEVAEIGRRTLTLEEAVQFFTWVDLLQEVAQMEGDSSTNGGLAVTVDFVGNGLQAGTSADGQSMFIFAAAIFDDMAALAELEQPMVASRAGCFAAGAGTSLLVNDVDGYCFLYPKGYTPFQPTPDQVVIAVDSLLNFDAPSIIVTTALADDKRSNEIPRRKPAGPTVADPAVPITLFHEGKSATLQLYPADSPGNDGLDSDQLYQTIIDSFTFFP